MVVITLPRMLSTANQQLETAHNNMGNADALYANEPSQTTYLLSLRAQRHYYAIYSRYVRQSHAHNHHTLLYTRYLRARALYHRTSQNIQRNKYAQAHNILPPNTHQTNEHEHHSNTNIYVHLQSITKHQQERALYLLSKTHAAHLIELQHRRTARYAQQKPYKRTKVQANTVRVRHPLTLRFVNTTAAQATEWQERYPDVYAK
jgi:hypothetical protein